MDVIMLYGSNYEKTYNRLSQFINSAKQREWDVVRIDSWDEILQIRYTSLFPKKVLFILHNFKAIPKDKLSILSEYIKKYPGTLILYQEGNIPKNSYKKYFKPKKVETYDIPKLIFVFLESFYPYNARSCIKLLHEITRKESVEFLFVMLARHVKEMYWVLKEPDKIPFASWKVSKLEYQANKFGLKRLLSMLEKLAEIDIKVKTSNSHIADELDLLIATQLE